VIVWAIVLILYQQVENNIIQPAIYRRTVELHPLVVIIAILVGGTLLGVLGALIAIPVAATIESILRDLWRYRREDRAAEMSPPTPPASAAPAEAGP
jgi:predicted PurR-regulated permease PerM